MTKTKILIPALNEGKNIEKVVNDFKKYGEVVVCDNNSSDNTAEKARRAGAEVIFQPKRGKGNAYKQLLKQEADIYVMVDSDDAFYAEDTKIMLDLLKNNKADLVIGKRKNRSQHNKNSTILRKIFANFFNLIFYLKYRKYLKSKVPDFLTGFRAFNKNLRFNPKSGSWGIETELTIHALKNKARIIEIPVQLKPRIFNRQKSNIISVGYNVLKVIFSN